MFKVIGNNLTQLFECKNVLKYFEQYFSIFLKVFMERLGPEIERNLLLPLPQM